MGFTFNKKAWEKNRPRQAHGSGVGKAIKLIEADCPAKASSITSTAGFDKAIAALDAIDKAFDTATGKVKPKDDKNGILDLIKGWKKEVVSYRSTVDQEKQKYLVAEGTKVADALYSQMLVEVNLAIQECDKTLASVTKDVQANKKIDLGKLAKSQQTWRTMIRDGLKYSTKAGKVDKIKFNDTIRSLGVDPAAIPLPADAKFVKQRVPVLEASVDALADLLDQATDGTPIADTGKYAKPVKALIAKYQQVRKTHKSQSSDAKKVAATCKKFAGIVKAGTTAETSKLVAALSGMFNAYLKVDGESLELQYSTRNSSGKIQKEYSGLVTNSDFPAELNDRLRDQRAAVFDAYRTVSTPLGQAKNQIDRAVKSLLANEEMTASIEPLVKDFDTKLKALSTKFGR